MKKLIIFCICVFLNSSEVPYNYNPFYESPSLVYKKAKNQATSLNVEAILDDKVFINGKWYKIGEQIGNYKLIDANYKSVMLEANGKRIFLPTSTEKTIKELTIKEAK